MVVALDQGDDVSLGIRDGEEDGVAGSRGRDPGKVRRFDVGGRPARIDPAGALRDVPVGKQLLHRDMGEPRVAHVTEQVGVRELLRLDHRVQRARRVEAPFRQREPFQHPQHQKRGDALPVRRQLRHLPPPVRDLERIDPFRVEQGQVLGVHQPAMLPDDVDDGLRRGTFVEPPPAALGDTPQRPRQAGILEYLPRGGRPTVNQERRDGLRVVGEHRRGGCPESRGDLHHRKAVLRVPDGGREVRSERQPPEAVVQRNPTRHGSGHRDGVWTAGGHLADDALAREKVRGHPRSRPAAGVHSEQRVVLRGVHDREEVAADAVRGRLHQPLHGVRSDGGIHGVSAAMEDLHRRLGGEGLAGCRDAVLRCRDGTAGDGQRRHHRGAPGHGRLLSLQAAVL